MKWMIPSISSLVLVAVLVSQTSFGFTEEFPSFEGMSKAEVAAQIRAQNFVLADDQKQQVKSFLSTYQVQPDDVKFLKQLAEANGFEYDKIKDTAFVQRLVASSTLRVDDAVAVLDRKDMVTLKQERFLAFKNDLPITVNNGAYRFRILDIQRIDGGVAVFMRAFKDNVQIGFGDDGTVDIERVRVMNPAVLVRDPNGDIVRNYKDVEDGEVVREWSVTYSEDYIGAITHNLMLATKNHLTRNIPPQIQRGKIGNTTTTVRPLDGTSVAYTDTVVSGFANLPWDTHHDATAAAFNDNTATGLDSRIRSSASGGVNWIGIYRVILGFDTSAVGSDSVSAATLTLTADGAFQDTFDQDVAIDHATPPSGGGAYALADYANANFDATDQAARLDLGSWSSTDGNTNDFTLNATGLGNINGSGNTFYSVRMSGDIDDNEPTWSGNTSSYASFYSSDDGGAGTTNDPVLVIEHATGGGAEATTTPQSVWFGNGAFFGGSVYR